MDANLKRALQYHVRALEEVVRINKLVASLCTGAVVLSLHELDILKHAPIRIVLLTVAVVCFGISAIVLLASLRYVSRILTATGTLVQAEMSDQKAVYEQLKKLGEDHAGYMRVGGYFFIAALILSCSFVVAQAGAALR